MRLALLSPRIWERTVAPSRPISALDAQLRAGAAVRADGEAPQPVDLLALGCGAGLALEVSLRRRQVLRVGGLAALDDDRLAQPRIHQRLLALGNVRNIG